MFVWMVACFMACQALHAAPEVLDATEHEFCQIIEIVQKNHLNPVTEDDLGNFFPEPFDCKSMYQNLKLIAEGKKVDPEHFILKRLSWFVSSLDPYSQYLWQKEEISKIQRKENQYELIRNKIGYVKLKQFHADTFEEFLKHYETWKKEKTFRSLVLDLRKSEGGHLLPAVNLLEAMLDVEQLFLVKTKDALHVVPDERLKVVNCPMLILVDENTKSAAELLAAVLQFHGRAKVIGQKTFGKGTTQTVWNFDYPWNDSSRMLLVTTSLNVLPNGRTYHEHGVLPDITLDLPKDIHAVIQKLIQLNFI
ncbi:MAG: hypothetical protein A3B70_06840 [Deltaproteobacteria bacterium RIFCSPHIGHO2_02_FULL_40_11]|nr:MAG: hypothetical protein A3B70_06840 [Deltaproteobacteria bacterium RIFCSPHIGHO2_02_FULL_40_11]